jgi:SAM-dependent methyltransferase
MENSVQSQLAITAPRPASLYDEKHGEYFSLARTEIEPLLPENTERILELGCGSGATIKWLRGVRNVQFAAAIELNTQAAALARNSIDQVVSVDFENHPVDFEPKSFDLILALDVLEHLTDPWDAVARLHAFLKPGGSLIASIPNVGHYEVLVPLLGGKFEYTVDGILDRTHLRFFTEPSAAALMESSGLQVSQTDYVYKVPTKRLRWYFIKFKLQSVMRFVPFSRFLKRQFLLRAVA